MPNASSSLGDPSRPRLDVRGLSLAQLQKLAMRGSQRARAELESRMAAADAARHGAPAAPIQRPAPATRLPPARVPPAAIPTLTVRAAVASDNTQTSAAPGLRLPSQSVVEQLELLASRDAQRDRADVPPRLIGMMLIVWGALVLLAALVMLARGGGFYYLFCALGVAAVGWLLTRRSRWAMALHGALLLAALAWAWRGAHGSLATALVQAAPLLAPAAWMAMPSVREPLE
jgi:hypothetical protein